MATSQNIQFISVHEALDILKAHDSKINIAIRNIFAKCNIPENHSTLGRFKTKFKKALNDRSHARKNGKFEHWQTEAKNTEFCKYLPPANTASSSDAEDSNDPDFIDSPKRRKISKPPLNSNLSRSAISKRVDAVLPQLQPIAEAENTTLAQLLVAVLFRLCKRLRWKTLAKLLYAAFLVQGDIEDPREMSLEKSTYMMVSQELGKNRYMDLRNTLSSEGFTPKPWHKVNEHCHAITPVRIPVTLDAAEGVVGYRFGFEDVCKYFVDRALQAAQIPADKVPSRLYIGGKDGTDGSGQHFRRAQVNVAVKGNILLYCFTPLILCSGDNADGKVLWRNPAPNSALTQRPLAIIAAKEDRDEILRPLIPQIEAEITSVSSNGLHMQYMEKDVYISVNSCLTMFDGKMHAALQGTGGAFCQLCKFSKVNCHCPEYVVNGFPVDRSIEEMHNIFNDLTESGAVPVPRRQGDYDVRTGVTAEPITHRELNTSLPTTHAWTCISTWFLNLLYHIVAQDKTWGFAHKSDPRHKRLMNAKSKVQKVFATVLGVLIDSADATGHSGNNLTGNMAKDLFSVKCRSLLSKLVKQPLLGFIETLNLNLEIILRIISSKNRKIDLDLFAALCTKTYIDILTHFKWADLTPSLHKVLAHAPELVDKNMCMGLGDLSEEGLEACHKIMRRFRSCWTLQLNDNANLKDLLRKMWLVSDPLFYSYRRTIKCPKCGNTGHQKNCPLLPQDRNLSQADIMVEEMYID